MGLIALQLFVVSCLRNAIVPDVITAFDCNALWQHQLSSWPEHFQLRDVATTLRDGKAVEFLVACWLGFCCRGWCAWNFQSPVAGATLLSLIALQLSVVSCLCNSIGIICQVTFSCQLFAQRVRNTPGVEGSAT